MKGFRLQLDLSKKKKTTKKQNDEEAGVKEPFYGSLTHDGT